MQKEDIARTCHEVNRAYCQALGDDSQPAWADAPEWQRESAMLEVQMHIDNPSAGPEASHESWMAQKLKDGWVFGEVKDEQDKTHPCLVPFSELPKEQQAKDSIFAAVVRSMAPLLGATNPMQMVSAAVPAGMVGIKYIGQRDSHVDHLYGTGLTWAPGQVHNVTELVAKRLLQHTDTYAAADPVPGEAVVAVKPAKEQDHTKIQVPLPHLEGMDKQALITFAQQHYGEKLHHNMNVENMRSKVLSLINSRGR